MDVSASEEIHQRNEVVIHVEYMSSIPQIKDPNDNTKMIDKSDAQMNSIKKYMLLHSPKQRPCNTCKQSSRLI